MSAPSSLEAARRLAVEATLRDYAQHRHAKPLAEIAATPPEVVSQAMIHARVDKVIEAKQPPTELDIATLARREIFLTVITRLQCLPLMRVIGRCTARLLPHKLSLLYKVYNGKTFTLDLEDLRKMKASAGAGARRARAALLDIPWESSNAEERRISLASRVLFHRAAGHHGER